MIKKSFVEIEKSSRPNLQNHDLKNRFVLKKVANFDLDKKSSESSKNFTKIIENVRAKIKKVHDRDKK